MPVGSLAKTSQVCETSEVCPIHGRLVLTQTVSTTMPKRGLPGSRGSWARFAIGLGISVLCLWLAVRDVPLQAVGQSLRQTSLGWVLAAFVSVVLTNAVKTVRWRLLFYPHHRHLPISSLFAILMAGQAVTLAFPVRAGELVRAYLVGARFGDSKVQTLATIVVEKLLDLAMLALLFLILIPLLAGTVPGVASPIDLEALSARQPFLWSVVIVFVVGTVLLLAQRSRLLRWSRHNAERLAGDRGTRGLALLESAFRGLDALQYPRIVLALVTSSILVWLMAGLTNYLVLVAVGLPASWVVSFAVLGVLQAGIVVPSSPGKVGVFQILAQWTLLWFGVDAVDGLVYGIVLYVVGPLSIMIVGGLCLAWESWQLRRQVAPPPPADIAPREVVL